MNKEELEKRLIEFLNDGVVGGVVIIDQEDIQLEVSHFVKSLEGLE